MKKYNVLIISLILVMVMLSGCSNEEMPPPDDPVESESNSDEETANDSGIEDSDEEEGEKDSPIPADILESTKLTAEYLDMETNKADFGLTELELDVKEEVISLFSKNKELEAYRVITEHFEKYPIELGDGPESKISYLSLYVSDLEKYITLNRTELEQIQDNFKNYGTPECLLKSMLNTSYNQSKYAFANDNCLVPKSILAEIEIYDLREVTDSDYLEEVKDTIDIDMYWTTFIQNYKLPDGYMTAIFVVDYGLNWYLYEIKILEENNLDFLTVSRWKEITE